MNLILWSLVATLVAALVLQGVALRLAHRRKLTALQSVLQRSQLAMDNRLEKAKRQIGQLQIDLSAARQQLKRPGRPVTTVPTLARQALERELDDDVSAARRHGPIDGFADTQPAPQYTQHGSLLMQ